MQAAKQDELLMDLLESTLARRGEEREAHLRTVGSSPDLVAEVLERAAWEERMGGFLQIPLLRMGLSEATAAAVPPGRKIGHYRVQEELGHGGMGVVFRAVDENLGRTVALKVLSTAAGGTLDSRRLLREAKAASALNHANIVTIHEFNSASGQDFIAMEYIEGKTLDKAVSPGVPLRVRLGYAHQIALALAAAHEAGIVHRDLKPGNIMVTKQGQVKVLDFGLAKHETTFTAESEETQTTDLLTKPGTLLGTPAYMSPEQVTGEPLDARSDIFSFGVILYEMVCGRRPFPGGNAAAILVRIAGTQHRPVREMEPAAPAALAALIDRCLVKNRENRLPSMNMAAAELVSILANLGERPAARRSTAWLAAAALTVIAAVGWLWQRQPAPAAPTLSTLRYSLLDDRDIAAQPGTLFHAGAKVRFRLRPSNGGYLYVVNEGPGDTGRTRLYVLMPRPGANAAVVSNEERLTGWLVFDKNPGVERMWLVWSKELVPSLEEAANGPLRGEVKEPSQAAAIQKLLGSVQTQGRISPAGSGNEMQVQGAGNTLASLVELRHQ